MTDPNAEKQRQLSLFIEHEPAEPADRPTVTAPVAQVALDAPLDRLYSYAVGGEFVGRLKAGMRVAVPVGKANRRCEGFCVAVSPQPWQSTLKAISEIIDARVLVDEPLLQLGLWMSRYYACPPGRALAAMVPSGVKHAPARSRIADDQLSIFRKTPVEPAFELNSDQVQALQQIHRCIARGGFEVILLHGVTASGKTELYIRAIQQTLAAGRQAIYLLPEIALTTQMVQRVSDRFESVAVLHSALTEAQRRRTWEIIAEGKVGVIVGTRSAVFAPVPNLGLIVVDEEQEPSYRNLQSPRFNTRDVAIKRAQLQNVPIILGSATPSLESFHNSEHLPSWRRLVLPKRVAELPMPRVELIDMRHEVHERKGVHLLSRMLEHQLAQTLSAGRQAILLLNRRGYASYVFCPSCRFVLVCPNCGVNMVYHKQSNRAICHHCSARMIVPDKCDRCGARMSRFGLGTQRVEEELRKKFPQAAIARMDTDVMTDVGRYQQTLGDFAAGRLQVLVGTQMIAKGLDFPGVALVGVISGDLALSLPDFRAGERTFQLLAQVAGRAGRADHASLVIVQSYAVNDPSVQASLKHDYGRFAEHELSLRAKLMLPPFARLVRIVLQHARMTFIQAEAPKLAEKLLSLSHELKVDMQLLGPSPCPIARMRNRYRYHIVLKFPKVTHMLKFMDHARNAGVINLADKHLLVDVDPIDLL